MLHATLMAGGSGTRFWPASRQDFPKQFLSLVGSQSMLQATFDRLQSCCPANHIWVLTNERLTELTRQQLTGMPAEHVIGEPFKRDTAPCIGLAASLILAEDEDATMLVTPADQIIETTEQFRQAVEAAVELMDRDASRLVTFGIRPHYPATVFGYIERGAAVPLSAAGAAFQVARFREKPDAQTAQAFLDAGNFYWNAGIFVWKARTILEVLREYEPEMSERLAAIAAAIGTPDFARVFRDEFARMPAKSIDFAVMERYPNVCMIEAPFQWDDVGNWSSLPRLIGTDENGNTVVGKQVTIETRNSIVRSTDDHLVVTQGIEDCMIIHTPDATLIADRRDESAMRKVVETLQESGLDEYL